MYSVNRVTLLGNLGADPELRTTSTGNTVTEMRLATSSRYKDKIGEFKDDVQWHRVVVWGKQVEYCKEYLAKGRQVYIEGRLQTRSWEDKEGNKRFTTEIVAQNVIFLNSKNNTAQESSFGDDEVPF